VEQEFQGEGTHTGSAKMADLQWARDGGARSSWPEASTGSSDQRPE
jgi:hypothetical protein